MDVTLHLNLEIWYRISAETIPHYLLTKFILFHRFYSEKSREFAYVKTTSDLITLLYKIFIKYVNQNKIIIRNFLLKKKKKKPTGFL